VEAVSDMDEMLRSLIGEDIELVTLTDSNPVPMSIDPSHLEQIILNLAVNARDAMPRGGKLTLEVRSVQLEEGYSDRHFNLPPGLYASLSVSDTGCGMDEATRSQIFEPFFTTKQVGKGTGLGLATVYAVVEQAGGHIWVYSEPDHGTVFKIYFPLDRAMEADSHACAGSAAAQPCSGTILLVEDEELVRDAVRSMLQHAGFALLHTDQPQEALRICRENPDAIDLLLTDVVMPEMNGRELAEAAAALRPDMKILFMSGYTDDTVLRHGILATQTAFIEKPFSTHKLVSKIQEVLSS